MEKFKYFITEAKEEKYRILVVSSGFLRTSEVARKLLTKKGKAPLFHTASRFKEEAKKLGHDVYILQVENAYISYENGIYKIFNHDDEKDLK